MLESNNQADSPVEFIELINCLKAVYEPWELPHIFLTKKFAQCTALVNLNELTELAQEAFIAAHVGKDNFDPHDPRFSLESFRNSALHAVVAIQYKIVESFKKDQKDNQKVYMLLVSDTDVYWEEWNEEMRQHLENEK